MLENCRISPLNAEDVPTTANIVSDYERIGGVLAHDIKFGVDPLDRKPAASTREQLFLQRFDFNVIFHSLANRDNLPLKEAITAFIDITIRLSN